MLYIVFEILLDITSDGDLDDIFLPFYCRGFLSKYGLLFLLGYMVVPLEVPLPTIVVVGYIAKMRLI